MGPVMIWNPPVVLLDGQHELDQLVAVELNQAEQVNEHVDSRSGLLEVIDDEGAAIEVVQVSRLGAQDFVECGFHLFIGASVVVAEDFEGHLVFLLGPGDPVVELGVMQRQTAVHGEHLERLFVFGREEPDALVHHLHDADHGVANEDRHTQDRLGRVSGELVDRPNNTYNNKCIIRYIYILNYAANSY